MSFFSYLLEQKKITQDIYSILLNKKSLIDCEQFQIIDVNYHYFDNLPSIPWCIKSEILYIATYNPEDIEAKDRVEYYVQSVKYTTLKYGIASKTKIQQKLLQINTNSKKSHDIKQDYLTILNDALKNNASDIHITPYANALNIMLRIDGDLRDYKEVSIEYYNTLAIALKVKAKLDIAENRRPQSGQFRYNSVEFRLSTHPTAYGENIVIRALNKDKQLISIESLGFKPSDAMYLKNITKRKQGLIIFCGPTGSGKSTSIYALIELMDKKTRNIMTLEDPIEYNMQSVRQTEIIPGIIDFVTGIRSILRQDPDVILIGEIRDEETAQMAVRASMTGHLVLTTIHANDCLGAISRLKHFNVPPSFTAENLTAIISQRLIKNTDCSGRTAIAEILKPDIQFRDLISEEASRHELLKYATENLGYVPLDQSALYA